MMILAPVLIIVILILLNGMFVAAEFAIVAVPRTRIKKMANEGSRVAKRIHSILIDPERQNLFITTAQVGITIASLGLGMYGEEVMAGWFLELMAGFGPIKDALAHTIASVIAVGVLTYFHVVIGEMIPKTLALQATVKTISTLVSPITIIGWVFAPIVWLLNKVGFVVTRLLGIDLHDTQSKLFTAAELEYVVAQSSMEGELEESDKLFIENIFDLRERTAEQIMTPRNRVVAISSEMSGDEILKLACEVAKTRYPVYKEDVDHIIGVLHIKDVIRYRRSSGNKETEMLELMRPTIFIPESYSLLSTLNRFRVDKIQMAVVVDEFGGTAGIVTMEDLIEEVVGEIQDEFDEELLPIEELSGNQIKVRGDVILGELNQHYDLGLEHAEATTIGGLVMAELGHIPETGEEILYSGVKIIVLQLDGHSIRQVLLKMH